MDSSEQLNTTIFDDEEPIIELTPALVQKRRSQGRIIFDRFLSNRTAMVGAIFLILMILICFLGPTITGHNNPDFLHLADGGGTFSPPSLRFPLGTDDVGRDQFARAMDGGQVSLIIGLGSMAISIVLGVAIGALAGYFGGIIDNILMRLTDVVLSVPLYLLLFVLSTALTDHSPRSVILLISIFGWTTMARLVRSEFIAQKEREYVMAARTIGAKNFRLMFRHILPNAAGPIIVNATLLIGNNIILESVLSFFGFGIQPPYATWGNMIAYGQGFMDTDPLLVIIPGLLIFLTVLSFNLVGDGLRDALDPYMTER
ncbi:oligopeptide transport system permease protein AppC [Ktedonobacteria bacterium brp13]|nr:oligopeptide transport system permease protein AppC [Ktedonobacteria bacterium brp13]